MNPKVTAARALAAYISKKSLRLVTIIAISILGVLTIGIWLLAHYFSPWWWVFIIPVILLGLVFTALRWVVLRIITGIYRHPFTTKQVEYLDDFSQKITGLVDARATTLPMFAFITVKDLLLKRDATTVKRIVADSTSLKSDFATLEKLFSVR